MSGRAFGYARVSTDDQNQLPSLGDHTCDSLRNSRLASTGRPIEQQIAKTRCKRRVDLSIDFGEGSIPMSSGIGAI
jgi:hypothetical protein